MRGNPWYEIVWIHDEDFEERLFPLVYLADGLPGYAINQYIYYLMEIGTQDTKLENTVRALCHLYAFSCARYGNRPLTDAESCTLIADFLDAKQYGTDHHCTRTAPRFSWLKTLGLHWEPLLFSRRASGGNTIKLYLAGITEFDKWQDAYYLTKRLSPTEQHFMNAWERFRDFKKRTKWDMLLHLAKSRHGAVERHQQGIQNRLGLGHRRHQSTPVKNKKAFPPDSLIDLIEKAGNVRDKMLFLMMAGGSLRRSEPLHLFRQDVEGMDQMGSAMIRLEDPEVGMIEWQQDGKNVSGTRNEYFHKYWDQKNIELPVAHPLRYLRPRSQMGRRNQGMNAGFKGMMLSAGDSSLKAVSGFADGREYDTHHLWWIDPRIGAYWYELFEEYEETYLIHNPFNGEKNPLGWPYHPWLFIRIDHDGYGMPMTITAMKALWKRTKERLGIQGKLGWHSLRHYFGYYCANVLGLPMETVQIFMHHTSITSTETYYHLSHGKIRNELTVAQLKSIGREELLPYIIPQKASIPKWPTHWRNSQWELWLKQAQILSQVTTETMLLPLAVKTTLGDTAV